MLMLPSIYILQLLLEGRHWVFASLISSVMYTKFRCENGMEDCMECYNEVPSTNHIDKYLSLINSLTRYLHSNCSWPRNNKIFTKDRPIFHAIGFIDQKKKEKKKLSQRTINEGRFTSLNVHDALWRENSLSFLVKFVVQPFLTMIKAWMAS